MKTRASRSERYRTCLSKRKLSADGARAIANSEWKRGNGLLPYRCQVCGTWHVGHERGYRPEGK